MEAAASTVATGTPFAAYHSSTHSSPPPSPPATTIRLPHIQLGSLSYHVRYLGRGAVTVVGRSDGNSRRASTFVARCRPETGCAGDSSSSTSPPPVNDLDNLVGATEPNASVSPPEMAGAAAADSTPPRLPPPSSEGLVFDVGPADAWDGREVGSPVVKRYVGDDKERWFMWYHGRPAGDDGDSGESIGLAMSANGIHWKRGAGPVESVDGAGLVLRQSSDWWAFDTGSLRPAEVVIMSSAKVRAPGAVYWMYYSGSTSKTKVDSSNMPPTIADGPNPRSLPGLAISQDGRHWARIEGEHYTGALLDVGAAGEWDYPFVAAPKVVYHGRGDLRMYYHSFDHASGKFTIGLARSTDGVRWAKLGKALGAGPSGAFDEEGVVNGQVVKSGKEGSYVMAYEGVSADGRSSIGLAESADGLKGWRRCRGGEAVLGASGEGGWDDGGVGSPCLVQMDGEEGWRLYYRGVGRGGRTGIGLAVAEGRDVARGRFTRWTGFCTVT